MSGGDVSATITLPRVVGTRLSAQSFLRTLPDSVEGQTVVLDCRALLDGTASFADEIVKVVLTRRGAARLVVIGAGSDFAEDLATAARDHGVVDRLTLEPVTAAVSG